MTTRAPLPERTIRRHLRDMRRLLERIDHYAAPADSIEQRHLTQAIHGLSRAAQALSARYHGRSPVADDYAQRCEPMAMLPNDHHPGPRCSCRDCLRAYAEYDVARCYDES